MYLKDKLILCTMIIAMLLCGVLAYFAFFGANVASFCASAFDINNLQNISITLKYQGTKFVYNSCEHIPYASNFLQERNIQKNNRLGTFLERAKVIEQMVTHNIPIRDAFLYMFFDWSKFFDPLMRSINKSPVDAKLTFNPNKYPYFKITQESHGYYLSETKVLNEILQKLFVSSNIEIELKPQTLLPNVYKSNLKELTTKLGSFSTSYESSGASRKHNIKLALSKFNGMKIEPHQSVSFNQTTGERTKEGGYCEAHMILDREYVDAVGGGVCQASTTLYNALLLSGVQIDEVHSHSLPSSYVELGFDAMVNFGTSDLVFTNQHETPVFIRTFFNNSRVGVEIYGKNYNPEIKIKRKYDIISKIPPANDKVVVDSGGEYVDKVEFCDEWFYKKQPQEGYKVKAFLEYYANGKLVKRKCIRTVGYNAQQGIKVFGAKKRSFQNFDEQFLQTLSNILGENE